MLVMDMCTNGVGTEIATGVGEEEDEEEKKNVKKKDANTELLPTGPSVFDELDTEPDTARGNDETVMPQRGPEALPLALTSSGRYLLATHFAPDAEVLPTLSLTLDLTLTHL